MVESQVGHLAALVEGQQFPLQHIDAVVRPAAQEVGSLFATQSHPKLSVLHLNRNAIYNRLVYNTDATVC